MQYIGQPQFGAYPLNNFSVFTNTPIFNGQLSVPNLYAPTNILGSGNGQTNVINDPIQGASAQQINDSKLGINLGDYPIECLVLGANCPSGMLGGAFTGISGIFQKIGLLLLALLLLGFGLYMLAKSTDTGQAAINLAKHA